MPLRKMKQKKYAGIYEYYRATDPDKKTIAYYINIWEGGKAKKIKTDADSADDAAIALLHHKRTKAPNQGDSLADAPLTVDQLSDRFFSVRTTINNAKDKRRYTLHVSPVIGSLVAKDVNRSHLIGLQQHLQSNRNHSPKTINHITSLVERILSWAFDMEIVPLTIPRLNKLSVTNERQRIFTTDEIAAILNNPELSGEMRITLNLAYYTAQRPLSLLRLKRKHIVNGAIHIETIKKQGSHSIPISQKLGEVLYPWIADLTPDDYVITRTTEPLSQKTLSNRILKLFEPFNVGLDYKNDILQWASLYTIRHSALTHLYANTADIYSVQAIANHSSVSMTQRYAKASASLKQNALDTL